MSVCRSFTRRPNENVSYVRTAPDSSSKRVDMRCLVDVIFVDHYRIEFIVGHTATVLAS